MANVIRIKRSVLAAAPTGLAQGELAYVEQSGTGDGYLYIGAAGATVEVIGGQHYIDSLNNYDPDLETFTLPASTDISVFGASIIDDADAAAVLTTLGVDTDLTTLTIGASATVTGSNTGDVTVSGTPNYITLSGQDIVRAQIDLTADVTGDLPFTNIAQVGTDTFIGRVTAATGDIEELTNAQAKTALDLTGTNSGDVSVSGTPNYITLSGQDIVRAQIDLTADVSGDLPFANIAQMATASFLARDTAATGDIEVLSATEATALLDVATITVKGLAPILSNSATQFLNGTGAYSTPAGGGDVSFDGGIAPANNALVRFDGVTGTIIQESQIIIDDTDNVTGMGTLNGKTIANLVSTDDTGSSGWTWFIDSDTMAGASATTLPSSESVVAYVAAEIATAVSSGVTYLGSFDPTGSGTPNLNTITSAIGDMYTVTVAGTYNFTTGTDPILEIGDVLIAEVAGTNSDSGDWTIVQNNLSAATYTTPGYVTADAAATEQEFGGTKIADHFQGKTDGTATLDLFLIDGGSF